MDGQSDLYYPLSEDKKCYALPHMCYITKMSKWWWITSLLDGLQKNILRKPWNTNIQLRFNFSMLERHMLISD